MDFHHLGALSLAPVTLDHALDGDILINVQGNGEAFRSIRSPHGDLGSVRTEGPEVNANHAAIAKVDRKG